MITKEALQQLIDGLESYNVERTTSIKDIDKFCEAICAFSNNFSNDKLPGYLLVGVKDNGQLSGLQVTGQLLKDNLSAIRDSGNILPLPVMQVHHYNFLEGDVAFVEVQPQPTPPVRYKGRVWIRIGPRKATASEAEEKILLERKTARAKTFDMEACGESSIGDINIEIFKTTYLPSAVDRQVIEENHRDIKMQLSSLRFYDLNNNVPTHAAIILFGINVLYYLPGAYIQFVRYAGSDLSADVLDEQTFSGDLITLLRTIESFLKVQLERRLVAVSLLQEGTLVDYPYEAVRELLMNAIMHRDYNSNAPIRFYMFTDRIEIQNPGGLYGSASVENFPNQNDYRNPVIAEALKTLGYVNKFSRGVIRTKILLQKNGNPAPIFDVKQTTYVSVKISKPIP
jgi:ATP-dependent DNA helicase RecG